VQVIPRIISLHFIILFNWIEVDEECCEAAIPVENLALVVSLLSFFDLLVERVEGDYVAEQVLKPCLEHVTKVVKLASLQQEPAVNFKSAHGAETRRWSQIIADPIRRVENVILVGHICGVLFIFPVLASLINVQNGLFEVLCAIHSAGEDLV